MAKTKRAPKAPTKAKRGAKKAGDSGITADFIRSLPKWKPALTKKQVQQLEATQVGSGNVAIDRRITLAMSSQTQQEMIAGCKKDIAEDAEAKTTFEILQALDRCEKASQGLQELARNTHARLIGALILVDDEDAKANGRPPMTY